MVLFLVDEGVTENRPLELEVQVPPWAPARSSWTSLVPVAAPNDTDTARGSGAAVRLLQVVLVVAILSAIVILLGMFGRVGSVVALIAICAGTVVTVPELRRSGGGWWLILAAGAALSLGGALLALSAQTLGGMLAIIRRARGDHRRHDRLPGRGSRMSAAA